MEEVYANTNVTEPVNEMTELILEKVARFRIKVLDGSFDEVVAFDNYIDPFEPGVGSSYLPLPPELTSKKAITNHQNMEDDEC